MTIRVLAICSLFHAPAAAHTLPPQWSEMKPRSLALLPLCLASAAALTCTASDALGFDFSGSTIDATEDGANLQNSDYTTCVRAERESTECPAVWWWQSGTCCAQQRWEESTLTPGAGGVSGL